MKGKTQVPVIFATVYDLVLTEKRGPFRIGSSFRFGSPKVPIWVPFMKGKTQVPVIFATVYDGVLSEKK